MKKEEIILPYKFNSIKDGIPCVYKLVFAGDQYYIGSTRNLKTRVMRHKSVLKRRASDFQRSSYRNLPDTLIKYVVIIQSGKDIFKLRLKESKLIKLNKGDNNLLNHKRPNKTVNK